MPRINLLPWREQQRTLRRKEFALAAGAAVLGAIMLALLGKLIYAGRIDAQLARNQLLQSEIHKLDAKIADILNLEDRKQRLVARMEIIEKLQRSRPEIVHLFDAIARAVPEGVYLTALKQSGAKLEIDGIAQSSTRVSTLMRNIDASVWMDDPVLQVVEAAKSSPTGGSKFVLFVNTVGAGSSGDKNQRHEVAAK